MKRITILLSIILLSVVFYGYGDLAKHDDNTSTAMQAKLRQIAEQLAEIKYLGGDHLGYTEIMLEYLSSRYKIQPAKKRYSQYLLEPKSRTWRRRREEQIDPYALLSGGMAIRESLQIETIQAAGAHTDEIQVNTLQGPTIKPHPYKKMLIGRTYKTFPLAAVSPYDFYYIHFNNMHKALDFFDYLNEVGGSVYQRFTPKSVDFHIKKKLLNQLGLLEHKEARKFYDYVIDEMIMVGSDPFLRNGSDVSLVFKIKQLGLFQTTIKNYRNQFKKEHKAKESTVTIAGYKGALLATDDRRIYSLYLELPGDLVLLSNSKKAAEIVVNTYKQTYPSMAAASDFQYMRSIYPADEKTEDVFIYLSDAFIRRLTGPELRIKEARRMREAIRLANLEKFGIFYYQLYGKRATNKKELLELLDPLEQDLFEGMEYTKDSFAATSKRYGRIGYMTPNLELELTTISKKEADDYKHFLNNYNDFWRDYFDPIGVRINMQQGTRIETCILPLIDNSIYNALFEIFGGLPVTMQAGENMLPGETFGLAAKINKAMLYSKEFSDYSQQFMSRGTSFDLKEIIGDEIELNMLDAEPMVDFDAGEITEEMLNNGRIRIKELYINFMLWSMFHPLRLSIPLQDASKAGELLSVLERSMGQIIRELSHDFKLEQYTITYKKQKIKVAKLSLFNIIKFRFFYTIYKGTLHITTTESYMYKVIDEKPLILAKKEEKGFLSMFSSNKNTVSTAVDRANLMVLYRPSQLKQEKNLYILNMIESAKKASIKNYGTYKLFTLLFPDEEDISVQSIQNFGFEVVCPSGGTYSIDKKGHVQNSIYGDGMSPEINISDLEKKDPMKRFFSTRQVKVYLEFTKEGIKTVIDIK